MKLKGLIASAIALPLMVAGCSCTKDGEYVEIEKMEAFSYINEAKKDNNLNMEGYSYVMEITMPDFSGSLGSIKLTSEGAFVIGDEGVEAMLKISTSGIDEEAMEEIYVKGNTIYISDGVDKKYASIPLGEEDTYSFFFDEYNNSSSAIPSFEQQILTTLEKMEDIEDIDVFKMTKRKEGTTTYKLEGDLDDLSQSEWITIEGASVVLELTFKEDKLVDASYTLDFGIMKTKITFEKFNGSIDFPSFSDYSEDTSILDDYYSMQ